MRDGSDLEAPELDQPVLELQAGQEAATQRQQQQGIGTGAIIPITSGGTGSATAAGALSNLGAAPSNATFITQTASAGLSAEQALAALATGYMKSTTATGVITTQAIPIPASDGGTGTTKLYVALLTQDGILAPSVSVLINTLGFTPGFAYDAVGVYRATSAAGFTANKTTASLGQPGIDPTAGAGDFVLYYEIVDTSNIRIVTQLAGVPTDGNGGDWGLHAAKFEICIYP